MQQMNTQRRLAFFLILAFLGMYSGLDAQIGGREVYNFMRLSSSARISGLGGNLITVRDDDVSLAFDNPASLNPEVSGALTFQHSFFFDGIQHGYFGYGQHIEKWKTTLHGGIKYIDYGSFDYNDVNGNLQGEFSAGEYAIAVGASHQVYERLTIGANLKFIGSSMEVYNSVGLAGDVAAMFHDTASRTNISLVFKNIGSQLTPYNDEPLSKLPYDVQIGFSKKLKHLPFRFSIIYHHLHRFNILYDDPNAEEPGFFIGDAQPEEGNPWFDTFFRHFVFNGEFLFGKKENFRIRLGYNHLRHKELTPPNLRSLAGFSFGLGLKINRFRLDYGREIWHLAGGVNQIGISTNINEFKKS
ncbi:MAG: type IX secretion system protein PorQ [Saprospiraceae bacterium]